MFLIGFLFVASRAPVHFADANLKVAVVAELNRANHNVTDPTKSDMLLLTSLVTYGNEISDLTGIGYAKNLTKLYLHSNRLNSLPAEIGNLTKLTELHLDYNQLTSLPA